jgi:hypothetical protein
MSAKDFYRNPLFEENAAPEAIAVYLDRERKAMARVGRRVTWLEALLERRPRERETGEWP